MVNNKNSLIDNVMRIIQENIECNEYDKICHLKNKLNDFLYKESSYIRSNKKYRQTHKESYNNYINTYRKKQRLNDIDRLLLTETDTKIRDRLIRNKDKIKTQLEIN